VETEAASAGEAVDWGGELVSIAAGARAARQALTGCYTRLPEKLAASRRGAPEFEPA
jgi:hypothetical protein